MGTEYPGFISYRFPDGSVHGARLRVVIDGPFACCYITGENGIEVAVPATDPAVARWMFEAIRVIAGSPGPATVYDLVTR